jgi:hypothetical protein
MMKEKQTGTLSEGFDNGDLCHNFGAVPAYFLSAKVLGASTILPLKNKQIQIQPQLGDLTYAEGTVVTELGLVKLKWKKSANKLAFSITVPNGVKAKVLLPKSSANTLLHINNKQTKWNSNSNLMSFELGEGKYTGEVVD